MIFLIALLNHDKQFNSQTILISDVGIHIEPGHYISRIVAGSAAAKEGNLAVGDRILNVSKLYVD